ncbi:MAG TPA: POTRA domain-containing protein [Bryobacteraceae bacterium]|nr:POTRA domain-containing protein [Bryobacteraceae bacterium]
MLCRTALVLICSGLGAFAQSPAMTAWPVGQLQVEGNKIYSDEQILAVAGLKVGQMAGKAEFDAAQQRLLTTGAFESVGYKFDPMPGKKANSGVFQVAEITQLFPYRFEELHSDEAALRAHLKAKVPLFGDKVPGTKPVVDRLTEEVRAFTKNADVAARLEGVDQLALVFRPASLPSVAQVTFTGNKAISTQKLQQTIAGAGVGAVYTENRFRQILDVGVRQAYEALGYLRVQFPKIDVAPAPDVKGVALNVHVAEGEVYKLAAVEVTGELAEASKELQKVGGFEAGEVANFDKIRAGVEEIRKALRRKGHIDAKVTSDRKLDDAKKTVTLVLNPDPGPQFTMGKLTIEGLDIETEPHVRKLWALKRGQPFNVEYPDYFLQRLIADQVMDNLGKTSSAITPDPERNTVDVTITLAAEKRPPKPKVP